LLAEKVKERKNKYTKEKSGGFDSIEGEWIEKRKIERENEESVRNFDEFSLQFQRLLFFFFSHEQSKPVFLFLLFLLYVIFFWITV
jgi:hypothetical protein